MSSMTFVIPLKDEGLKEIVSESIRKVRGGADQIMFMRGAPSMAKAYNDATAKAKHERLCFVHEDVTLRDSDYWSDDILDNLFEQHKVGFLGVAGSKDVFVAKYIL